MKLDVCNEFYKLEAPQGHKFIMMRDYANYNYNIQIYINIYIYNM